MSPDYTPEEREFVKLVGFFNKHAEQLAAERRDDNYLLMLNTSRKLLEQLDLHVQNRKLVHEQQQQLNTIVKDNARCPNCESNANLKLVGTDTNDKGWKSNKYRCRRCNIEFVWNAPNNPVDMIGYAEHYVAEMEKRIVAGEFDEATSQANTSAVEMMKMNLGKLKPVVEAALRDMAELQEREKQMTEMVNKVRKHLLIEKIRLDM